VKFTIDKTQDGAIKSPKLPEFYNVKVNKIDATHIAFVLTKPYSPFLQNLTIGILPKHLWGNLSDDEFPLSQYNVEPIGSGPYKVDKMTTLQKNMLLIPTYYDLVPFDKYVLGEPYINDLIINFYADEQSLITAYNNGDIEAMNSISPDKIPSVDLQKGAEIKTSPLPRTFAVFFNQNQSQVLAMSEVREALNAAVDRQAIINQVLGGYGQPIYGPVPAGLISGITIPDEKNFSADVAENILTKAGWAISSTTGFMEKKISKKQTIELDINIATLNSPNLVQTAQIIQSDWQKIGANVTIQQYEFGDLQQNVIRPRKFDALLYGTVTGQDMDFFSFWDSSQRNDPGLNIAMYANSKVDALLENARTTSDESKRVQEYDQFNTLVEQDVPAVFLYSPEFIYITPSKVQENNLGIITDPFERFLNINTWYIETNNIWKIFQK
jgi:peptide/nickel transport system substrate-binding protein